MSGQPSSRPATSRAAGLIRQRDRLNVAFEKFDVNRPRPASVIPGQAEHPIGHIQAIGPTGRADPASRQQHIDTAAGTQVEHRLAGLEAGDGDRITAAQAGRYRVLGDFALLPDINTVDAEQTRLAEAGLVSVDERDTTCCYAKQDKFWVKDAPNGESWEFYTVLEDSATFYGADDSQACCGGPAGSSAGTSCC